MRAIEAALPENDGVRWFNVLYRRVTEAVQAGAALWEDWPFLQRFDVAFAKLYFEAIITWESDPDRTPRAWRPLFQARGSDKLVPLQFALAGMNAHINNDLVIALDRIARSEQQYPSREGQRYRDFQRVNDVLERVEVEAAARAVHGRDCCDRRGARRSRHDSGDVESPARARYGVDQRGSGMASPCGAAPPERVPRRAWIGWSGLPVEGCSRRCLKLQKRGLRSGSQSAHHTGLWLNRLCVLRGYLLRRALRGGTIRFVAHAVAVVAPLTLRAE